MAELVDMLEGGITASFIVDDHRANAVIRQITAHDDGGKGVLQDLEQNSSLLEEPVGHDDEALDPALQQQFEIALELFAVIMCVHDEGQVTSGVESLFDATKDQGAEGIGEIKDQDSDGAAVAAAQRAGGGIGVVPEGLGGLPDTPLGGGGNAPGGGGG